MKSPISPIFLNGEKNTWHPATIPKLRPKQPGGSPPTVPWSRPRRNTCSTQDTPPSRKDFEESLRPRGRREMDGEFSLVSLGFFQVLLYICHYICLFGEYCLFSFFEGVIFFVCMYVLVHIRIYNLNINHEFNQKTSKHCKKTHTSAYESSIIPYHPWSWYIYLHLP